MNRFYRLLMAVCLLFALTDFAEARTELGIDVLQESNFDMLKGKKFLLFTNQSGRNTDGKLTAQVLKEQKAGEMIGIMTPEHGFWGAVPAGEKVSSEQFKGVPVHSLYGVTKSPNNSVLSKADVVVIDIQDIGIRSYTYISSMLNVLKTAAKVNKPVIVLDRPNPLGGLAVDGNIVVPGMESFVGSMPISYIHGCTIGELAYMANEEGWLDKDSTGKQQKCKLTVVKMKNWYRFMSWENTGLAWFPTSPHIPTVDAIRGSAVIGVFGELGIINIGIGTTLPFQYIGSPEFKTDQVLDSLADEDLYGLILYKARFKPFYAKYSGTMCEGIMFKFDGEMMEPYTSGLKIFFEIKQQHPELFIKERIAKNSQDMFAKVTGNRRIIDEYLSEKGSFESILKAATFGLEEFKQMRTKYLMYE